MEDPLFDPWGPTDEARTASGGAEAVPTEMGGPGSRSADQTTEPRDSRWRPIAPAATPVPRRVPKPVASARDVASLSEGATVLRDLAMPMMRRVAHRLELARHQVVIDDRTDREPPSIRFQVRPRGGPFDGPRRGHPVLELIADPGVDGLLARRWRSQAHREPDDVREIPLVGTRGRLSRTLLDFVENALAD